jgi:hypothetical protein
LNAKSEDEAIAAIEALGGEFIVIESEPRTLDLGDAQITDAGIEHLKGQPCEGVKLLISSCE